MIVTMSKKAWTKIVEFVAAGSEGLKLRIGFMVLIVKMHHFFMNFHFNLHCNDQKQGLYQSCEVVVSGSGVLMIALVWARPI